MKKPFTPFVAPFLILGLVLVLANPALAQTDARPENMEQVVPEKAPSMERQSTSKKIETDDRHGFDFGSILPSGTKKVKSEKGFLKKLLNTLNPLKWFSHKRYKMHTGLGWAIVGLIVMLAGALLNAVLDITLGASFGLGSLIILVGAVIFVIGIIIWLLDVADLE